MFKISKWISDDLRDNYRFAFGGLPSKIALGTAAISCFRILYDLTHIEISKVIGTLLKVYFSIVHVPINEVLSWFHLQIPSWSIDSFLFYSLMGFVIQRVRLRKIVFDFRHPWIIQHNFKDSRIRYGLHALKVVVFAFVFWPLEFFRIVKTPYLVVGNGAHGPSALTFLKTKPPAPLPHTHGYRYFGDARVIIFMRVTATFLGVLLLLVFNYITGL